MKLGIVKGKVWASKKVPEINGCRLLDIQPVDADANEISVPIVVADPWNIAGPGDRVVYVTNTDATQAFESGFAPVNAAVVELVDAVV